MPVIIETEKIHSAEAGPISADVIIGSAAPVPAELKITAYTTAWGTDAAHAFNYPADILTSVFQGAVMQIVVPAGAVLPVTWVSSNPTIASIDNSGVVTWKIISTTPAEWQGCSGVTFEVTDAAGMACYATFTPASYYVSAGVKKSHSQAESYCDHFNAIMPTAAKLTNSTASEPAVRKPGTLWGEWGDLTLQDWAYNPTRQGGVWAAESGAASGDYISVLYITGEMHNISGLAQNYDGICELPSSGKV